MPSERQPTPDVNELFVFLFDSNEVVYKGSKVRHSCFHQRPLRY